MGNSADITKLAGELSAGVITAEAIRAAYGSSILSAVLGVTGGLIGGIVAGKVIDFVEEETGIVSDIGGLVDDVFSIFD